MSNETATMERKVSKVETGHNINVANFAVLINCVKSYGGKYNPTNSLIGIKNLEDLKARADIALTNVGTCEVAYKNAIRERADMYELMNSLVTRMQNALASSATRLEAETASQYLKKIRGDRKKKTKEETDEKTRSTSQRGYDNRLQNFREYCQFMQSIPAYKPNETDLQVKSVTEYADSLAVLNEKVTYTWNELDNARTLRNKMLYDEDSGIYGVSSIVKKYAKSVFSTASQEYQKVSDIKFSKRY